MIKNNSTIPTIIAFVGESGSGKTTIAQMLEKYNLFPSLVSYTTRPIRDNEINGVDHYFVSENIMPERDKMLAYTYFSGYHYWTELNDIKKCGSPIIYIIDEKGLIDLYQLEKRQICKVIWVQIERANNDVDINRKNRDKERLPYLQELFTNGYKPNIIINNNTTIEAACMQFIEQLFNMFNVTV